MKFKLGDILQNADQYTSRCQGREKQRNNEKLSLTRED